jgi:hypothetical protein
MSRARLHRLMRAVSRHNALHVSGLIDDLPLADDDPATWPISSMGQLTPAGPPATGLETGAERLRVGEATGRKGSQAANPPLSPWRDGRRIK